VSADKAPKRIVRTYGRGSFLAFLSPLLAMFMASRGMNGWERSGETEAQRDALDMERRGYRVIDAEEYTIPMLGIVWFKVIYELDAATELA
jgi:hypothetical protein